MDKKRPSDICFIKFKEARTFLLFYLDLNANYYGKLALVAVSVVISCHETTEFHIYETLLSHITKKHKICKTRQCQSRGTFSRDRIFCIRKIT